MREIFSFHVGQMGIQTGSQVWKLLIHEYSFDRNNENHPYGMGGGADTIFDESSTGNLLSPNRYLLFFLG